VVVVSELQSVEAVNKPVEAAGGATPRQPDKIDVSLLTGGLDKHYSLGLIKALVAKGVHVEVIGSDAVDSPELHVMPQVKFLNLRGDRRAGAHFARKVTRVLSYYFRLIRYALRARPKVFHILWNNKFEYFDRTLLMLFYKLCGKKIALTAHNVNIGRRDSADGFLNRLTLKIEYRLVDHIFVHTDKMKAELCNDFGVYDETITVLIHPLNVAVPETGISPHAAKEQLGIRDEERTILFFGAIAPYKGLDILVEAFHPLAARDSRYRLVIAGRPKEGECEQYWQKIQSTIARTIDPARVLADIKYIPDQKTEIYFKAADVLVLPYREIFQSGILFLAYSYGLPIVATDVGSFRETLIEGKTGFLCRPNDAEDLRRTIEKYFESELFTGSNHVRDEIREYARARHSWDPVGQVTRDVYAQLSWSNLS